MIYLKSLVLLLALANAMFFMWVHGVAAPPVAAVGAGTTSKLKLMSESPPPESPASAASDAASALSSAAVTAAVADAPRAGAAPGTSAALKRCLTIGPFADVAEAAHAAATLRGGGYEPRQRVMEGDVWAGVWVYLPMPTAPAAAEQLRARLKAAHIDDALEMPGPEDKQVISLGLFSDPRRAQARITEAKTLGLVPAVVDRKRTGDVYWVDVDLKPTDSALNPADLQAQSGRIVRLEVKACPAPESPKS